MNKIIGFFRGIFKEEYSKETYEVMAAMIALQEATRIAIEDLKDKAARGEMCLEDCEESQAIFQSAYWQIIDFDTSSEKECVKFIGVARRYCKDPFGYIQTSFISCIWSIEGSKIQAN